MGLLPIEYAHIYEDKKIIELLIEHGSNIDLSNNIRSYRNSDMLILDTLDIDFIYLTILLLENNISKKNNIFINDFFLLQYLKNNLSNIDLFLNKKIGYGNIIWLDIINKLEDLLNNYEINYSILIINIIKDDIDIIKKSKSKDDIDFIEKVFKNIIFTLKIFLNDNYNIIYNYIIIDELILLRNNIYNDKLLKYKEKKKIFLDKIYYYYIDTNILKTNFLQHLIDKNILL